MLGVGKIAEGDAVHGLVDVLGGVRQRVKAHIAHVLGHGFPVPQRSLNARRALVVAVVVGQAEHPEPQIIQRIGNVAGGGKARVAAGGKFVVDQRFLIQPVYIKLAVEFPHILIHIGKIIVPVGAALARLDIQPVVDQVIPRGGKPHRVHRGGGFGRRLRRGFGGGLHGRCRNRGDNRRGRLGQKRTCHHAADPQRDHAAGQNFVTSHSHGSLPRSKSVMAYIPGCCPSKNSAA